MPKPATSPVAPTAATDRSPEPPTAPNPAARADTAAPTFDIVRVEPSGEAVVAGKGQPDSKIALLASGKVVAESKTDANGQFVMTPPALKPGAYDLSLQQKAPGDPPLESKQAVAVSVPETGKGPVVVALAEPGKPTRVLAAPVAPPSAAAAPPAAKEGATDGAKLAVRSVELENGTGFYATGTAPAKSRLRVYLNDSHLADLTAGADGGWTLRIRKGLTGGRYKVRVDALGTDGRKVEARVEVPFDVPVAVAKVTPAAPPNPTSSPATVAAAAAVTPRSEAPAPPSAPNPEDAPPPASPVRLAKDAAPSVPREPAVPEAHPDAEAPPVADAAAAPSSNAVIDSIETALVAPGDNLWNISRVRLGEGTRYTRIYTANADQIRDPNLIYPGQIFVVPKQ